MVNTNLDEYKRGEQDSVPYSQFVEHLNSKPEWQSQIQNTESPFMRLLQEDDLFLTKKIITNQNTTIQDLSSTMSSVPKHQSQLNIDTFTFKIFCLLMCKGSNYKKSNILFDLVIGSEGLKQGKQNISWRSSRLVLAIKKIVYFSDLFIQNYCNQYLPI